MIRAAALLLLLEAALAPAFAQAQEQNRIGTFRDWTVACDNRRDCRAIGFSGGDGEGGGNFALDRAAEADAAPRLWMSINRNRDALLPDGVTLEVSADDAAIGRLVVGTSLVARDEDRLVFDVRDEGLVFTIVDALRRAGQLRFAPSDGSTPVEISLDGASAALLFMDDRQRRVGTASALVRRGDRPASSIPAPPRLAPDEPGRPHPSWRRTPETLPDAVIRHINADQTCDTEESERNPRASGRLAADLVLVEASCVRGAYNFGNRYYLWNDRGGRLTALTFPLPPGAEGGPLDMLFNGGLAEGTLQVTHFSKGRGPGDCGDAGAWRWDGRAFRLVRYRSMPRCQGLLMDDWFTLHRSE